MEMDDEFRERYLVLLTKDQMIKAAICDAGLMRQAKPGEVILMDNYAFHCSKAPESTTPAEPISSGFIG